MTKCIRMVNGAMKDTIRSERHRYLPRGSESRPKDDASCKERDREDSMARLGAVMRFAALRLLGKTSSARGGSGLGWTLARRLDWWAPSWFMLGACVVSMLLMDPAQLPPKRDDKQATQELQRMR